MQERLEQPPQDVHLLALERRHAGEKPPPALAETGVRRHELALYRCLLEVPIQAFQVLHRGAPFDAGESKDPSVQFFHLIKNLTADGYYTSQIGLIKELGYSGNTAMAEFPTCLHEH